MDSLTPEQRERLLEAFQTMDPHAARLGPYEEQWTAFYYDGYITLAGLLYVAKVIADMSMSPPRMFPVRNVNAMVVRCPYCGYDEMTLDTAPDFCILCLGCGAHGPLSSTAEEAVILWNGSVDDQRGARDLLP